MSVKQVPFPRQDRRGIGRDVIKYPKPVTPKVARNRATAIRGDNGYATRGRPVTTK